MSWIQLKFDVTSGDAERFSELLSATGALSVTLQDAADQPLLEPEPGSMPLWNAIRITGLYQEHSDPEEILASLRMALQGEQLPACQVERLADQVWERVWMERFKPMRFGQRLWICPSWADIDEPGAVVLRLDPGLAFGTGTHETTAMCLEWLDGAELRDRNCLDFGCGSGILAIAAARLGAARVCAVDIDAQALLATRENARSNQVLDKLSISSPDALEGGLFDVVIANILAGPLANLAADIAARVCGGGHLVMSGILSTQAEEVQAAYSAWFDFEAVIQRNNANYFIR